MAAKLGERLWHGIARALIFYVIILFLLPSLFTVQKDSELFSLSLHWWFVLGGGSRLFMLHCQVLAYSRKH